jgi:hypothetical protein
VVELGLPRLAPLWIEPWRRGTLDSIIATLGVRVGGRWTAPLVAVIDVEGKVVAQWQGHTDPDRVLAAVAGASPGAARTAQR